MSPTLRLLRMFGNPAPVPSPTPSPTPPALPTFTLSAAIVVFGDQTSEGTMVESLGIGWFRVLEAMLRDPAAMYQLGWREWEEMIAGAYEKAGFDEVILTPRSGDLGRDVIAVKKGVGSLRILDQMKAYKAGHLVPANDVRAVDEVDRELKLAMSHLAKSLGKVLKAAHPGKHFRGAFKTLDRVKPGGLEVAIDCERMFVRAGRFEIELCPFLTAADEDELLDDLKARQWVRKWKAPAESRGR